jgi:hypothetical protein
LRSNAWFTCKGIKQAAFRIALGECSVTLGGRRIDASEPAERRDGRSVARAAPRLALLTVPQWMVGVLGTSRPSRVYVLVVDGLLEPTDYLAVIELLRFVDTAAVLGIAELTRLNRPHLVPSVLFDTGSDREHLRADGLPESAHGVAHEEGQVTTGVETALRHHYVTA